MVAGLVEIWSDKQELFENTILAMFIICSGFMKKPLQSIHSFCG